MDKTLVDDKEGNCGGNSLVVGDKHVVASCDQDETEDGENHQIFDHMKDVMAEARRIGDDTEVVLVHLYEDEKVARHWVCHFHDMAAHGMMEDDELDYVVHMVLLDWMEVL